MARPWVIARQFPGGLLTDEAMFTMTIDHFALQHRLPLGTIADLGRRAFRPLPRAGS